MPHSGFSCLCCLLPQQQFNQHLCVPCYKKTKAFNQRRYELSLRETGLCLGGRQPICVMLICRASLVMSDTLVKFAWDLTSQLSHLKKGESFDRFGGNKGLPVHIYLKQNYILASTLSNSCQQNSKPIGGIRCLTNAEFMIGKDKLVVVEDTHPLSELVGKIQPIVMRQKSFMEHAHSSMCSVTNTDDHETSANTFWETSLKCVEVHIQQNETTTFCSAYYPHVDKVGNLVAFSLLQGETFVFVSTPSKHAFTSIKNYRRAGQNQYRPYTYWKKKNMFSLGKRIDEFEKQVHLEAKNNFGRAPWKCHFQIRVYHMKAGDTLCFLAKDYVHGSIIPSQRYPRVLAILHQFIPV